MRNESTAIYEQDGEWTVAYYPELPGANGQVRSKEEARQSLAEAISAPSRGGAPRCAGGCGARDDYG